MRFDEVSLCTSNRLAGGAKKRKKVLHRFRSHGSKNALSLGQGESTAALQKPWIQASELLATDRNRESTTTLQKPWAADMWGECTTALQEPRTAGRLPRIRALSLVQGLGQGERTTALQKPRAADRLPRICALSLVRGERTAALQ